VWLLIEPHAAAPVGIFPFSYHPILKTRAASTNPEFHSKSAERDKARTPHGRKSHFDLLKIEIFRPGKARVLRKAECTEKYMSI
jgi:hypothetical protein